MITGSTGKLALALAMTALLAACAIKPLAEWRDSNFSGTVDNILIIGVSDQPVVRRLFEDTFVKELEALGVSAKSSYQVLTDEQISSKDALDTAIRAQSMDAVLVTRVIGVEEINTYTPPTYTYTPSTFDRHYRDYHSYFNHAVQVATPGYWDKYEVLKLESNLYNSASQQLIWSIQSESFDPRSATQLIDDQITVAITSLRNTGLIPD
ncbi:MAG: hypothetical protein OES20_17705 [Gammaproteobacteria bacterium]|nr:hypothetical protein [Gammaproteobacteria bacterium]MDH3857022.1 hypothetical protein [Gammaproteobacteria bacterium]